MPGQRHRRGRNGWSNGVLGAIAGDFIASHSNQWYPAVVMTGKRGAIAVYAAEATRRTGDRHHVLDDRGKLGIVFVATMVYDREAAKAQQDVFIAWF